MELNEENIKSIYQNMLTKTSLKSENCPDDETLFNAVINKQGQKEKFKIIDHVFECGYCNQKFNAFRDFHKESKKINENNEDISISKQEVEELVEKGNEIIRSEKKENIIFLKRLPLKYISTIAALFIIVIGSILFLNNPEGSIKKGSINNVRGTNNIKINLVSPKGFFNEKELIFKWDSVKNADKYSVKLYNEELTCIWTSPKTKINNCKYPLQSFNKIKKEKIFFWKIIVEFKDKEPIKSKLSKFTLSK